MRLCGCDQKGLHMTTAALKEILRVAFSHMVFYTTTPLCSQIIEQVSDNE